MWYRFLNVKKNNFVNKMNYMFLGCQIFKLMGNIKNKVNLEFKKMNEFKVLINL